MSSPNSWAKVSIKNDWRRPISFVTLKHRYDTKHYDQKCFNVIDENQTSQSFPVGFWTGFGRTGKDYWQIIFESEGYLWTCKDNFYCYLTRQDVNGHVICRLYKDRDYGKMEIICPKSSNCIVSLSCNKVEPNSSATVAIKNYLNEDITDVCLKHRYDYDHFDSQNYDKLEKNTLSEKFRVGFWTGFGRIGSDYWYVSFKTQNKILTSPNDLRCLLTKNDVGKNVLCHLYKESNDYFMAIVPPNSTKSVIKLNAQIIPNTNKRPVYLIGHRVNSPSDIAIAIDKGCNAVECDLRYSANTQQIYVNHDINAGPSIYNWLNAAKDAMHLYKDKFALIIFDCKFADSYTDKQTEDILFQLRNFVRHYLNHNEASPINIVFSIANFKDRGSFIEFMKDLNENEALAIDMHDNPKDVENFYKSYKNNCGWYGNGIFVAGIKDVYPSIKQACELRDAYHIFKKTYVWTLAKQTSIEKYIEEAEVDGCFVNVPCLTPPSIPGVQAGLDVIQKSNKAQFAKRTDSIHSVYQKK